MSIMTKKRLIISALVSVVLAMPMGGFIYGFIHAPVSEYYNHFLTFIGRGIYGIIYAILTTGCLGFPPEALEDHAQSCNVWPYIIIGCLIIFGTCTGFAYYKGKPMFLR